MRSLLISGARQRPDASELPNGTRYEQAVLMRLDLDSGRAERVLVRDPSPDAYPEQLPSILFGAGARADDELYLCTNTEILVMGYPDLELRRKASYPFFNEVHSVTLADDRLLVTSTGLDLVVELDRSQLRPLAFHHALGKDPRHRFDWDERDYRKVNSTKPHEAHPNYAFALEGELWATRFNQMDAVCLGDPERRIEIGVERPHDGHAVGGRIWFTTVNGHLVGADAASLRIVEDIDLAELEGGRGPLGWCRGLAVCGSVAYVGFSRLRLTRFLENVRWLGNALRVRRSRPTRIVAYDLERGGVLREYPLPEESISALFGMIPEA